MRSCGIVVEYNPLHNGHVYHIQEARKLTESDCMIAVMSGNFMQRGEPAILDKFSRTEAALQAGVDLVVELPFLYAVQHADLFAKGAVAILDALGADHLVFGSEDGTINAFHQAQLKRRAKKGVFDEILKQSLEQGLSYPEASRAAYENIGINSTLDLQSPNNILGFAYLRAAEQLHANIHVDTIPRIKADYHDQSITGPIASATSIRSARLRNQTENIKQAVPESTYAALQDIKQLHSWEDYFPLLRYLILTHTPEVLRTIQGMDEGLEYRFKRYIQQSVSFQQFLAHVKTKRYTWTRLQRVCVHLLTNSHKELITEWLDNKELPYIRILGMSKAGRAFLSSKKKQLEVPLFTQLKDNSHPVADLELQASDAYYSTLLPAAAAAARKQEISPPIFV
ncbi:Predicted nucleotidyltransferase [Terribacillus aidingensis]|uniref:tRNA(Met) cytidine acetate ligase n=1 Tax=Terribacillus aidingensis TaxID=586416 RepID=A0A285NNW6_9BACI|nr:nucleotidyltransferase [Terribacillus aidingensis]SNZ09331.1 Predicted nucleotidyltransferase [Terribacillus aidingensis]